MWSGIDVSCGYDDHRADGQGARFIGFLLIKYIALFGLGMVLSTLANVQLINLYDLGEGA
jgi:hypothetical protein